jgi:hypothetical protein
MAKATTTSKKSLFTLDTTIKKQIRYIAFTDETTQTEVVNQALTEYVQKWEKKNGKIPLK